MSRYEKLILLLALALVATKLGSFVQDLVLAKNYGATGPSGYDKLWWENLSIVWSGLVNLAAAVWVFSEARAAGLRAWLWSLLGLLFGLVGIVLFYAIRLYGVPDQKET